MRKLTIGLVSLALVLAVCSSTAFATSDEQGNNTITVNLTIDPYTQIWFQDDAWGIAADPEPDINFSGTAGVDWYRSISDGLIGTYLHNASKGAATDGFAVGFFESHDGATIWMQSNVDLTGNIACSGDLTGSDGSSPTIPTWFTVAVTGCDKVTDLADTNGFRLGNPADSGNWVDDGLIPFASMGGYGGDDASGLGNNGNEVTASGPIYFGGQGFYGTQDAFRMNVSPYSLDLDAPVGPGTMKFLARCKRLGVHDPADTYAATLTVTFTIPA